MDIIAIENKKIWRKLVAEISWSTVAKLTVFPLFYLTDIAIARLLNVESYGTYSYFFSIFTILLTVSFLGINSSSRKLFAIHHNTEDFHLLVATSVAIRIGSLLAFVPCLYLFSLYLLVDVVSAEIAFYVNCSLPMLFVACVADYIKNIYTGLHELKYVFMQTITEFVLKFILTLLILLLFQNILSILIAFTIAFSVSILPGTFRFYRKVLKKIILIPSSKYTKIIFFNSAIFFMINLFHIVIFEIDIIFIGYYLTDTDVGIYAVAKKLVSKLPQISLAIALGSMPVFAKLNSSNVNILKDVFKKLIMYVFIFYVAVVIVLGITAHKLIPLFYGQMFLDSVLPFYLLLPYVLLASMSILFSNFLDYQNYTIHRLLFLAITLVVNIVLNIFLIPKYGIVGASFATTLSFVPYFILNSLLTVIVFKKSFREKL